MLAESVEVGEVEIDSYKKVNFVCNIFDSNYVFLILFKSHQIIGFAGAQCTNYRH